MVLDMRKHVMRNMVCGMMFDLSDTIHVMLALLNHILSAVSNAN